MAKGEYGEPWDYWYEDMVWSKAKKMIAFGVDTSPDAETFSPHDQERSVKRAVDCANAFDGCPDPQKFIEAAKRVKVLNEKMKKVLEGAFENDAGALLEEISEILESSDFAWLGEGI